MVFFVFLLPILTGALLVHLLWPERGIGALVFKAFLGIGIGLGINSLSYFLYLFFFAGRHSFIVVQVAEFALLLAASLRQERKHAAERWAGHASINLSPVQHALFGLGVVIFVTSMFSTASYILRRKQGDWDAWMMYNRAARFVYRDQQDWLGSFSAQMDPIFHADYPLFLAMNIASGWDVLRAETPRVPMLQSALFAVACAGLFVSALAFTKSTGQAALGLIVLWGTPAVVNEGARELADLPLAYFFLGTGVLVYLYAARRKPGLLVLAGLSAGMAAWVKNEGSVFVIAGIVALLAAFLRKDPWQVIRHYLLGLAIPMAVVLGFKLFLAPPSDVLSSGPARSLAQAIDLSRHLEILRFFGRELLTFGGWRLAAAPVGIIVVLLVYLMLARMPLAREQAPMAAAGVVLLGIQLLGYYAVYVITPYDLTWHLSYSIERVYLQVFPLMAFMILSATQVPEHIFQRN